MCYKCFPLPIVAYSIVVMVNCELVVVPFIAKTLIWLLCMSYEDASMKLLNLCFTEHDMYLISFMETGLLYLW